MIQKTQKLISHEIKLVVNRYGGQFYKKDRNACWRKFFQMGNAGVSYDIVRMLRMIGINVIIEEIDQGDEL